MPILRIRSGFLKPVAALALVGLALGATACDNNGPKLKPPIGTTTTIAPTTTTTTTPVPTVIADVLVTEAGGCDRADASDSDVTGCRELSVLADGTWTLTEVATGDAIDDGTLEQETLNTVFGGFSQADLGLLSAIACNDSAPFDGVDILVTIGGDGIVTSICDDAFGTDANFAIALEALYVATGWND